MRVKSQQKNNDGAKAPKYLKKHTYMSNLKNGIPSEAYYSLLEWKDKNLKDFQSRFGEVSLDSLTYSQLQRLYQEVILGIKE